MAKESKPWYTKWWAITLFVIVGLMIIGSLLPDSETETSTQSQQVPTTQQEEQLEVVYIGGIEDGECLVPQVNLWNKPGGLSEGATVTNSVEGCVGLPVQVVETQNLPPRIWYHVQTYGANKGKSGWVSETLVIKN